MAKKSKKKAKRDKKLAKEEAKVMICRVCLINSDSSVDKNYTSLYDNFRDHNILHYLVSIANVKINENDGLPTYICVECFSTLELAIDFKQRCEYSDTYLHKTLQEISDRERKTVPPLVIKKEKEEPTEDYTDMEYLEADFVDELPIELENVKNSYDYDQSLLKAPVPQTVECNECGEHFKSKCKLRVHLKTIHKPIYSCEFCKRIFKSYLPYKRHRDKKTKNCLATEKIKIRMEGTGKNRRYFCLSCDYSSRGLHGMKIHSVTHTGEKPFQCNLCPNSYTQVGALLSHKENVHQEIRVEITCNFCGKHVQGRQKSYRHLKLHSLYRYQCDICNAFLKGRSSMVNHLQRHSSNKNFTCELCAASFYTNGELITHKRLQHMKLPKKKYYCGICAYQTVHRTVLNRHKQRHGDYNKFVCETCGKFFDCQKRRDNHVLRHNTEHQFKCTDCDKHFMRKDSLCKHIRKMHRTSLLQVMPENEMTHNIYIDKDKSNTLLNDMRARTENAYETQIKADPIPDQNTYNLIIKEKNESVQKIYDSMIKQETEVEVIIE